MEFSRYPEEYSWKRSCSEERDRSDQNDDTGIGRSYECVFCKRGFTTAQALGGHMNIHRKDRAKPKPKPTITPNSPSTKLLHRHYNDYSDHLGFYYSPTHDHEVEVEVDATSSNANNYHYPPPPPTIPACSHHLHYPDQEEDVLAQDWSTRTLTFFSNHPFSLPQNKHNPQRNNNQEVPLDLELRLGYHHP